MTNNSRLVGWWDSAKEHLSLGGLLTLKMELQILNTLYFDSKVPVYFSSQDYRAKCTLLSQIFQEPFEVKEAKDIAGNWPSPEQLNSPLFSYQNFERVRVLSNLFLIKPVLQVPLQDTAKAGNFLDQYSRQVYTVHLKQTNGVLEESNANLDCWVRFFKKWARAGKIHFILLGADSVSSDILRIPGVVHAEREGLSLSEQLALIPLSRGFLGMASGICQAAIFSHVPYVIFKHPHHHPKEMRRELGSQNQLPFASPGQQIWREKDEWMNLNQAFCFLQKV